MHPVKNGETTNIALTYMSRVLSLTLLAPDIVEAIPDGTQALEVTLALEPFRAGWLVHNKFR